MSPTLQTALNEVQTPDEIREVYAFLKGKQKRISFNAAGNFVIGQAVKFNARGGVQQGIVSKVNSTTVSVRVGTLTWRVSASLLQKA